MLLDHQVDSTKKTAPLWATSYSCSQVTSLQFSPSCHWLAAACLSGELYLMERVRRSSSTMKRLVASKREETSKAQQEERGDQEQQHKHEQEEHEQEQPVEEWMHARVVNMIPRRSPDNAAIDTSNNSKVTAMEHIGPSLVAWLSSPKTVRTSKEEEEHASGKASTETETATNVAAEILIGVHGPTQRWMSICPSSGLRYRTIASSLESMNVGMHSGDTRPTDVQHLFVDQGTLTISTTDPRNAHHCDTSHFF